MRVSVWPLLLLSLPQIVAAQEAMFRGNAAHTGVYDASAGGQFGGVRWRVQTGGPVRSSPTIADGVVFIGSSDGQVYALDERDGSERWRTDAGSAVTSTPAVARGTVVVAAFGGHWLGLDVRSGAVRWRLNAGAELPLPWGHESGDKWLSSPTIVAGQVLLGGGDGVLRSADLATGRVRWTARTAGRIRSSPAIANGTVVTGDADGVVYAFDLASGAPRWTYETYGHTLGSDTFGYDRRTIQSSPAILDGVVYVGARDGFVYALDLATGALRWKYDHNISWINTSPAVESGRVYAGSSDRRFAQALDAATGREIWRDTTDNIVWSSPSISGSYLFFADGIGRLTAADKTSGVVRWRWRAPAAIWSSPVVHHGLLYVGADDGAVYALDVAAPRALRRAVYWDSAFVEPNTIGAHVTIRTWFVNRDYELLDGAGLARFMTERIADGAPSVVVFAMDHVPAGVAPNAADTVLLRRYLNAGGTIVDPGLPPGLWPRDPGTGQTSLRAINRAGVRSLLGVSFDTGNFDPVGTSVITPAGRRLGMTPGWMNAWAADPASVTEVLALDEQGLASAFVKSYGGPAGTGFIRIPAVAAPLGSLSNLAVIQAAAELRRN